jgi:siroheme synthase (precorrin-2 oxidase/ferrochelatase)
MRTHPVFLRLDGRRCVVIGGDETAAVKARACIDAGADVTVVAPTLTPDLARTVASGGARHVARSTARATSPARSWRTPRRATPSSSVACGRRPSASGCS